MLRSWLALTSIWIADNVVEIDDGQLSRWGIEKVIAKDTPPDHLWRRAPEQRPSMASEPTRLRASRDAALKVFNGEEVGKYPASCSLTPLPTEAFQAHSNPHQHRLSRTFARCSPRRPGSLRRVMSRCRPCWNRVHLYLTKIALFREVGGQQERLQRTPPSVWSRLVQ